MGRRVDWVPAEGYGIVHTYSPGGNSVAEAEFILAQGGDALLGAREVGVMDDHDTIQVDRVVGSSMFFNFGGEASAGEVFVRERIRIGLIDNDAQAAFYADAFMSADGHLEADEDANEPFLWERSFVLFDGDFTGGIVADPRRDMIDVRVSRLIDAGEALFYSFKLYCRGVAVGAEVDMEQVHFLRSLVHWRGK